MYHYTKKVEMPFETAVGKVTESLSKQGFGVLTTIDVKETLKKKLNVDFGSYKILGACNPQFAHRALSLEPSIGVMLPCNVVVREDKNGNVEISAINPMDTIAGNITNEKLKELAAEVSNLLRTAIDDCR